MILKKRGGAAALSGILAAVLMFTGCGGTQNSSQTGQSGTSSVKASENATEKMSTSTSGNKKITDKKVKLSVFCDFSEAARAYYTDLSENPVVKKMMEETGVELEFVHPPVGDDGTYFQQLLASGDLPDIMATSKFQTSYPGGVEGAISDGVLYNVTDLVTKEAPNFWNLCKEENDPDIEKKIRGDEGDIIKFGTTWLPDTDNHKCFNGLIVRQDLLDKFNLKAPVTIDEYTNVLRTFKENGIQVPLALCKFDQAQFSANNPIASAFDVAVADFIVDDQGEVHYSRTQDGYREFLGVLKQWADEGLIDTDFVSRTIDDSLKLFENGTAGMCFAHTYNVMQAVTAGAAINPDFKITCLAAPRVNADDTVHESTYTSSVNSMSYQVSAQCKNPEVAVKFIDYLMDPDTILMTAWGTNEDPEHQTYTVDSSGKRTFTDFVKNNPDGLDYNTVRALYMCQNLQIKYDETMEAQQYDVPECHQSWEAWGMKSDGKHNLPKYLTLTEDESKKTTEIKNKLSNYSDEKVYQFIFGQDDIDAGWDEFVKNLKELGSEEAEGIYKAAYDRYMAR